jgi:hypothetical protein
MNYSKQHSYKKSNQQKNGVSMIDFRNYMQVNESIDTSDFFDDEFDVESPFIPIEIGDYIIHIFASENNYCLPQINSFNPWDFASFEIMIEKNDPKFDFVVVTHKIFNEMGYVSFGEDDIYAAYVPVELVQEIFEYLVNKIKLPIFDNIKNIKQKKKK